MTHAITHTVEYIGEQNSLAAMVERINAAPALALDIETINWWDRAAERVALVQLAFREKERIYVAVIDALTGFDLTALRAPLELSLQTKAIHNASYDAVRLARHYGILTSPIHDTMLAARRSGQKKCSLQAQAAAHLGIELDKTEQRGDWSRRPLNREQLEYAALDATCTLMLYEQQMERGMRGDYELQFRTEKPPASQSPLPLSKSDNQDEVRIRLSEQPAADSTIAVTDSVPLEATALALLGIVTELDGRYSPEQLAASVGSERIGLAGWIVDRLVGAEEDFDEDAAKQQVAALCDSKLIHISPSRRLEATSDGARIWRQHRPSQ